MVLLAAYLSCRSLYSQHSSLIGGILLFHPQSSIKYTVVIHHDCSSNPVRQVGISARRSFQPGDHIWECYGILARDIDSKSRTDLSEIEIHPEDACTGPRGNRLLGGPMRFCNHDCRPNCEVLFHLINCAGKGLRSSAVAGARRQSWLRCCRSPTPTSRRRNLLRLRVEVLRRF